MTQAYPLAWPAGWPRTGALYRSRGRFGTRSYSSTRMFGQLPIGEAVQRVMRELEHFGVLPGDAVLSTNLKTRLDGLPAANSGEPADPGVAVYWLRSGEKGQKVMAIDIYDRVEDNLGAIAATLSAMRAIERHGGAKVLERAFTGFIALPAPGQTSARGWPDVLGVAADCTLEQAKTAYRTLSGVHHPDRGGSQDAMSELNWAWNQAQEALK